VTRFEFSRAVFFHFHGLIVLGKNRVEIGRYKIPDCVFKYIYKPYLKDIRSSINKLIEIKFNIKSQSKVHPARHFFSKIKMIIKDVLMWLSRFASVKLDGLK
jgi:hypothetical protein